MANAGIDDNYVKTLLGVDETTGAPVPLETTTDGNRLKVDIGEGGTSGTQYTEGATDTTLTGTVAIAEGPSDTATPLQVDSDKLLKVTIEKDSVGIGGGTQYTEDAASAVNPVGNALILVRDDGRVGTLTNTDGDNVAVRGNNKGEMYVKDTDVEALLTTIDADTGAIKTAVETLDNAISGSEMQVDVVAALPAGDNNIGNVDLASAIPAGTNNIGDVDVASLPGTVASDITAIKTATEIIDNAISGSEMQVDIVAALPAGANAIGKLAANSGVDIGDVDVTSATITGGATAHDAADAGNPIKVGGRAVNAEITAVANNDRTDFITDLAGKQIVLPYANPENFVSGAITSAMTGTTSTSLIAAPASGLRNYITTIIVSNSHATVGTDVIIQDGSGGTTLMTIPAAAVYGGAVINLPVPLRQPTTATAIHCANVTTGASTKVSAVGYKGV